MTRLLYGVAAWLALLVVVGALFLGALACGLHCALRRYLYEELY